MLVESVPLIKMSSKGTPTEKERVMTDQVEQNTEEAQETVEKQYSGQKIMCFISKKMVPIEDTVEVDYAPGKSYRVLPQYIKYSQ